MTMNKRDAEWILGLEGATYDWSQLRAAYLIALRETDRYSRMGADNVDFVRYSKQIKKAYRLLKRNVHDCSCDHDAGLCFGGWEHSGSRLVLNAA